MGRILTSDEVVALSSDERLHWIAMLWDSLAPGDIPVPASHLDAIDDAIADREARPDAEQPWDEVKRDIFRR